MKPFYVFLGLLALGTTSTIKTVTPGTGHPQGTCGIVGYKEGQEVTINYILANEFRAGWQIWRGEVWNVNHTTSNEHPHNPYTIALYASNRYSVEASKKYNDFVLDHPGERLGRSTTFHCVDGTSVAFKFSFPVSQPESSVLTTEAPEEVNSCVGKAKGLYADPYDCGSYIECGDSGEMGFSHCPKPLLFDSALNSCNIPQLVDCNVSCVGREDGVYPMTHDCVSFVACAGGQSHVLPCLPPLRFDKVLRRCVHMDSSTCDKD